MLKKLFDAEPVLVRGLVLAVFMIANHFGAPLADWAKFAVNLAALAIYAWVTRSKVTPNHQVVTTTADYPKELSPMPTAEELIADLKDGIAKAKSLFADLWNALPPEFQHPALDAAKAGVDDLGTLAETEVAKVAPAPVSAIFDTLISNEEADAAAKIETINAASAAKIAGYRDAQAAAAAVQPAAVPA